MTEPVAPAPSWRLLISPKDDAPESYVPISGPRHLAILRRLAEGPTAEDRERWAASAAQAEAERRQALRHAVARHTVLAQAHSGHPVARALLDAHGPHLTGSAIGRQYAECHGCPSYWEHSEYEEPQEVHHEWPCPTWTTIAEQTEKR